MWLAAAATLLQCTLVHAAVYKCIGPDGAPTYSDKVCDPKPAPPAAQSAPNPGSALGAARDVPVVAPEPAAPVSDVDRKLHELLVLTQVSARESPGLAEVARTLVPRVDPDLTDMSQDPRWAGLSRTARYQAAHWKRAVRVPFISCGRTTLERQRHHCRPTPHGVHR
jgi:hypothetical protein